jgi:hypothetical protein
LIGSSGFPITYAALQTSPPGLVVSQLFEYDGRYQAASTIVPGRGYWLKASAAGKLISTPSSIGLQKGTIRIESITDLPPPPPGSEAAPPPAERPREFFLGQNFPNPFNPSTTIAYALPSRQEVQLKVFNILGQEVATLFDGIQEAGDHSVQFDAGHLPSGVYLYKITAGSFTDVRKMAVIK